MRARFYDPTIGRFLSEDPIWSTNLYPYADNNPVTKIDPMGLKPATYYALQFEGNYDINSLEQLLRELEQDKDNKAGSTAYYGIHTKLCARINELTDRINNTNSTSSTNQQDETKKQLWIVRLWNRVTGGDAKEMEQGTGFGKDASGIVNKKNTFDVMKEGNPAANEARKGIMIL
jgi:hypothetical protein